MAGRGWWHGWPSTRRPGADCQLPTLPPALSTSSTSCWRIEADRADGVVVGRDGEFHGGRVGIGVNHGDHGNLEAARFGDGDAFAVGVDDDHGVRQATHVADALQVAGELLAFAVQRGEFLFGHRLEERGLLDVFEVIEALDALADGLVVGEHAAQPTVVDVELAGGVGGFLDGFLGLALAADKQDFLVLGGQSGEEGAGFVEALDGFLDVDDVDAALLREQVGLHARVPFFALVAVMDPGFDELLDEFADHFSGSFLDSGRSMVELPLDSPGLASKPLLWWAAAGRAKDRRLHGRGKKNLCHRGRRGEKGFAPGGHSPHAPACT